MSDVSKTIPELIAEARKSVYNQEHHSPNTDRITSLAAELATTTEQLERVRAAVNGPHPANSGLDSYTLAHISAALDGAPEPEDVWEYGYELIEPDDRNVFEREGDFISAAFAYRAAKKRIDEEHQVDLPRLQYPIVRRRKAGPWLPVEGESDGE